MGYAQNGGACESGFIERSNSFKYVFHKWRRGIWELENLSKSGESQFFRGTCGGPQALSLRGKGTMVGLKGKAVHLGGDLGEQLGNLTKV